MNHSVSPAFPPARQVREGSNLAVVAPSSPFDHERFESGVAWLRERYEVRFDEGVFSKTGYFAGSDERRLRELLSSIKDPEIDAILCARGGYGAGRLLPEIDPEAVASANKFLVGYSDATALHALWARAGVRSIHAPMVAALGGKGSDGIREEWIRTLEGKEGLESWNLSAISEGSARGRLSGGNLAVLCSLLGTPYAPPIDETILLLEDIGERPYRIDRMLTSLTQAGWFNRCAGIVIGAFTESEPGDDGISTDDVIAERLGKIGIPVVTGFSAGHIDRNEPLTFGAEAAIEGNVFTISA